MDLAAVVRRALLETDRPASGQPGGVDRLGMDGPGGEAKGVADALGKM